MTAVKKWEVGGMGKQPRRTPAPPIPTSGVKCGPHTEPTDEKDLAWRLELKKGDRIDAKDTEGLWYAAEVLEVRTVGNAKWIFVTFDEWNGDKYGANRRSPSVIFIHP